MVSVTLATPRADVYLRLVFSEQLEAKLDEQSSICTVFEEEAQCGELPTLSRSKQR